MSNSALSSRRFLIYLIGSTVSLHGLWIYRVALGWFAWKLTGSEFWVGIVAFTQFAPAVVFGPLLGVFADRVDPRKASIVINSLSALNMLLLGLLTWSGMVDIFVLTAQSLIQGGLDGAHTPVRMTLLPKLVEKVQLQSAIASASITFNVSRLVGPAIAGVIIAMSGVGAAFAINGLSYLAIIAAVAVIKLRPGASRPNRSGDVWDELISGVRYTVAHKTIRGLLMTIAVASVFGRGALEMMPAIADVVYQRGAAGLATLTAAVGVGAIMSGLVLSQTTAWLNGNAVRLSVVTAGIFIAIFGINHEFWLAVPLVTVLGVTLSLCGVGSQILIQTLVEEEVRGRVSSLWGMVAFGGTACGSLIVGSAAAAFGLQITVVASGIFCVAAASLIPKHKIPP